MENKKLINILLKDMKELEELVAEMKINGSNDPLEFDFLQTKTAGIRHLLELLQHKLDVEKEEPVYIQKNQNIGSQPLSRHVNESAQIIEPFVAPEIKEEVPEQIKPQEPEPVAQEEYMPEPELPTSMPNEGAGQSKDVEEIAEEAKPDFNKLLTTEIKEEKNPAAELVVEKVQPEISIEPEVLDESDDKEDSAQILGEKFAKEKSLNETLPEAGRNLESKLSQRPVSSLQSAIGINDRFLFTRELFEGDSARFADTVKTLDQMGSISEAVSYLRDNYKWKKNEASLKFVDLVKRRFAHD